MLIISSFLGRISQNIIQILRCIHFAKIHNHNIIQFPEQSQHLLNSTQICLDENKEDNKQILKHDFFYMSKFGFIDPSPNLMKQYFQQYIRPIYKINYKENINEKVYIHIRGEDIYKSNPHPKYLGTSLAYYEHIIDTYYINKEIVIVSCDNGDPCIDILCQRPNISFFNSGSLTADLEEFTNIKHLIMSTGLFGFQLYLLNDKLETVFMPDYTYSELVQGDYGTDINLNVVEIPNYIKVGDWTANDEQKNLIINYKFQDKVIIKKM